MGDSAALDIGSRRELLVDRYMIDRLDGVSLKLHEPQDEGIALQLDKPWEAPYPCYVSIVKDGDLYPMWYRGLTERTGGDGPNASRKAGGPNRPRKPKHWCQTPGRRTRT